MKSDPYPKKTSHLIFERRYQFYVSFSKRKEQRKCSLRTLQRKSSSAFRSPGSYLFRKILGDGFAVIPSEGKIYAPTDGEIAMVFDTLHAITLTSSSGTEILIHIGLDTVTLKGAPFTAHVAAGDQVKKGDLLMDVDLDKITGAGLNTVTPVLICNTDDYGKISLKKEGEVSLDEAVLSIS